MTDDTDPFGDLSFVPIVEVAGWIASGNRHAFAAALPEEAELGRKWGWYPTCTPPKDWRSSLEALWPRGASGGDQEEDDLVKVIEAISIRDNRTDRKKLVSELSIDLQAWSDAYWRRERDWKRIVVTIVREAVASRVHLVGIKTEIRISAGRPERWSADAPAAIPPNFFYSKRSRLRRDGEAWNGHSHDRVVYENVKMSRSDIDLLKQAIAADYPNLGKPANDSASNECTRPTKRSRKPGRDYRQSDSPLILEMKEMIEAGKATSPDNAALYVVDKAAGSGVPASKAARLAKHYRDTFPTQP